MPKLTLDASNIVIDGVPAFIQAGMLHYYHLPHHKLWKPLLDQFRVSGFNAVMVAFPWSYHSPAEGFYDFTGPRDIRFLLDSVSEAGLWLIAHVGPWIGSDFGAGGIPPWVRKVPQTLSDDESSIVYESSESYLHSVTSWWNQLFPYFIHQPNHLLTVLHPGRWTFALMTGNYKNRLSNLATRCGITTPIAWPVDNGVDFDEEQSSEVWFIQEYIKPIMDKPDSAAPLPLLTTIHRQQSLPVFDTENRRNTHQFSKEQYRSQIVTALKKGARAVVLDPVHLGCSWGYWGSREAELLYYGSLSKDEQYSSHLQFLNTRSSTFITETLSRIFISPELPLTLYASQPENLIVSHCTSIGSVALLESEQNPIQHLRLSLPSGDETIISEDIPLPVQSVRILPLNMQLAGGVIKSMTLEPVLITETAGRTLCILRNENGGSVNLTEDFRPQHIRGGVRCERTPGGWLVQFDAERVNSIVFDGPDQKIQFLALASDLANRVWSLDDRWRTSPVYPANWSPSKEDPAREIIIGPDLVVPDTEGRFRYMVSDKGYGYRWGPWRGSDPRTWLAPFSWQAPNTFTLPPLNWEVKCGAVELLPDYPDTTWWVASSSALLTMENCDNAVGFVWYRGLYKGSAAELYLQCSYDCDVFLNGNLIATLKTPPDFSIGGVKTVPLPERYQRETNSLAILVENRGRVAELDTAQLNHGLISCQLSHNVPVEWRIRTGVQGEKRIQGFFGFADWHLVPANGTAHITWYRSELDLDFEEGLVQPIFLRINPSPGKLYIYCNGVLISRSAYDKSLQHHYWLPDGLLDLRGSNEVMIMQWTRGAEPLLGTVSLVSGRTHLWHSESYVNQ